MFPPRRDTAFTLVELIVAMAVIAILISAIFGVSISVINSGKVRDTQATLDTLELAVDQFRKDAPLGKMTTYNQRFIANSPPDELDVFVENGYLWPATSKSLNIAKAGTKLTDAAHGDLDLDDPSMFARGTKAMALTISLYGSEETASILDRVDARYRRSMGTAEVLYYDPGVGTTQRPDASLVYFVDSWETPIDYFSTYMTDPTTSPRAKSDRPPAMVSMNARRDTSDALVRANNNEPVFVSYGPDGPEQFAWDFRDDDGLPFDIVKDWEDYRSDPGDKTPRLDHKFNEDNVYSNPDLPVRLGVGQ